MHISCPDFDLCQDCESQPIPVHPENHPLLKMKTPATVIPKVEREFTSAWPRRRECAREQAASVQSNDPTPPVFSPESVTLPPIRSDLEIGYALPRTPWIPSESLWTLPPPCPLVVPTMIEQSTPPYPPMHVTTINRSFPPTPPSPPVQFPRHFSVTPAIPSPQLTSPTIEVTLPPVPDTTVSPIPILHLPPVPPTDSPLVNEGRLIDIDEPEALTRSGSPVASSLPGLTTPSDVPESNTTSIPRLGPVNNQEWRELWPELTTMFRHLLQPVPTPPTETPAAANVSMPGDMSMVPQCHDTESDVLMEEDYRLRREHSPEPSEEEVRREHAELRDILGRVSVIERDPLIDAFDKGLSSTTQEFHSAIEESPLAGEALLNRPEGSSPAITSPRDFGTSLTEYLARMLPPVPRAPEPSLSATFVSDNNIPDGQIFPPGAEFVKSWKMLNNGNTDWPESCELVFVAGDRLAPFDGAPRQVTVGSVPVGTETEVTSGEMKASTSIFQLKGMILTKYILKAPDVPGKYVSYWRLRDDEGHYFGQSVWVE